MFLHGGLLSAPLSNGFSLYSDAWLYNLTLNSFTHLSAGEGTSNGIFNGTGNPSQSKCNQYLNRPCGRAAHVAATITISQKTYVVMTGGFGGVIGDIVTYTEPLIFDLSEAQYLAVEQGPTSTPVPTRFGHAAVSREDAVYMWGGMKWLHPTEASVVTVEQLTYDE